MNEEHEPIISLIIAVLIIGVLCWFAHLVLEAIKY